MYYDLFIYSTCKFLPLFIVCLYSFLWTYAHICACDGVQGKNLSVFIITLHLIFDFKTVSLTEPKFP